jgi:hypothetical protein
MAGIPDYSRSVQIADRCSDEYQKTGEIRLKSELRDAIGPMLKLPDYLRDELKKPLGQLVDEQDLLRLLRDKPLVVSVGDYVTYTLLKYDIKPLFCVVDFNIKREHDPSHIKNMIKSFGDRAVVVKNSPGTISDELWRTLEEAFEEKEPGSFRIEVDGEEDLAALPAIFLAPGDVTVIYGLPDRGVVVVKATDENKKKVQRILEQM